MCGVLGLRVWNRNLTTTPRRWVLCEKYTFIAERGRQKILEEYSSVLPESNSIVCRGLLEIWRMALRDSCVKLSTVNCGGKEDFKFQADAGFACSKHLGTAVLLVGVNSRLACVCTVDVPGVETWQRTLLIAFEEPEHKSRYWGVLHKLIDYVLVIHKYYTMTYLIRVSVHLPMCFGTLFELCGPVADSFRYTCRHILVYLPTWIGTLADTFRYTYRRVSAHFSRYAVHLPTRFGKLADMSWYTFRHDLVHLPTCFVTLSDTFQYTCQHVSVYLPTCSVTLADMFWYTCWHVSLHLPTCFGTLFELYGPLADTFRYTCRHVSLTCRHISAHLPTYFGTLAGTFCYTCRHVLLHLPTCFGTLIDMFRYTFRHVLVTCRHVLVHLPTCFGTLADMFRYTCPHVSVHFPTFFGTLVLKYVGDTALTFKNRASYI
jgi:hypothetical protein